MGFSAAVPDASAQALVVSHGSARFASILSIALVTLVSGPALSAGGGTAPSASPTPKATPYPTPPPIGTLDPQREAIELIKTLESAGGRENASGAKSARTASPWAVNADLAKAVRARMSVKGDHLTIPGTQLFFPLKPGLSQKAAETCVKNAGDAWTKGLLRFHQASPERYLVTGSLEEGCAAGYEFKRPVFRLFNVSATKGRTIYRCKDRDEHFSSFDAKCEGKTFVGALGKVKKEQEPGTIPLYFARAKKTKAQLLTVDPIEIESGFESSQAVGFVLPPLSPPAEAPVKPEERPTPDPAPSKQDPPIIVGGGGGRTPTDTPATRPDVGSLDAPQALTERIANWKPSGKCYGSPNLQEVDRCKQVAGQGTPTSPYQIRTAADFTCMEVASGANWVLKNDITVSPADYQIWKHKRFIPISCFSGRLDGEFHTIRHLVDCQQFDCKGSQSEVSKDVALFNAISGIVMNLKIDVDLRSMRKPYKEYTQFVSGLTMFAEDAVIFRVSVSGRMDVESQYPTGFVVHDHQGKLGSLLEQVQADFEVTNANSYPTGLMVYTEYTTISNSVSRYRLTGEVGTAGLPLGMVYMPVPWSQPPNKPTIRNSYHVSDYVWPTCNWSGNTFPLGKTAGDVVGSFWSGNIQQRDGTPCANTILSPHAHLQRNGAALAGVFDEFKFDPRYWVRGSDGLPKLKWLQ